MAPLGRGVAADAARVMAQQAAAGVAAALDAATAVAAAATARWLLCEALPDAVGWGREPGHGLIPGPGGAH